MPRRITGLTPSGDLQLGNYLGAIRPMVEAQRDVDSVVLVADLHAMTVAHDPAELRRRTLDVARMLLAAGVDPGRTLLYVQSHVPAHTELHYLLECATGYGEAHRMIQFKEKATSQRHVRLSLLTYPVLQAADILLHDADEAPVGDDQAQHIELARDVAIRFNGRYGQTFVVPKAVTPPFAARVMDLADPRLKMGKTNGSGAGVVRLLDPPDVIRRKVMRAVTDAAGELDYDPQARPGAANLLQILSACVGDSPSALVGLFRGYRELKEAVCDAVVTMLRPLRKRYAELGDDPGYVREVLAEGAQRACERTAGTLRRARHAMGVGRA